MKTNLRLTAERIAREFPLSADALELAALRQRRETDTGEDALVLELLWPASEIVSRTGADLEGTLARLLSAARRAS